MADFQLQEAAECGNEDAMFELGHKYMSFDYDEARSYFESAKSIFIADGNQQKVEYIDSILELLSSSSQEANNYLHKLNWEWMNRRRECKCQHTFVQKMENFFVHLPVLCFSLLSL